MFDDDGWQPPDEEWLFDPEYEPPPGLWWQQPGAIRATTAGACVAVLGVFALVMFTAGGADSTDSDDRLPVVLPGIATSLPQTSTSLTSTSTTLAVTTASVTTLPYQPRAIVPSPPPMP